MNEWVRRLYVSVLIFHAEYRLVDKQYLFRDDCTKNWRGSIILPGLLHYESNLTPFS